jgi:hypothetical protein
MDIDVKLTELEEQSRLRDELFVLMDMDHTTMVSLRRSMLMAFRMFFSNSDNYSHSDLKHPPIVYSPREDRTLDVELDFIYAADRVNQVPGVYVGFGTLQNNRVVIGDKAGTSPDNAADYFLSSGVLDLNVRHRATAPDMAYMLADHSVTSMMSVRHTLTRIPGIKDIELVSVGSIGIKDPHPSKEFQIDVMFKLSTELTWTHYQEGHRLKTVGLSVS